MGVTDIYLRRGVREDRRAASRPGRGGPAGGAERSRLLQECGVGGSAPFVLFGSDGGVDTPGVGFFQAHKGDLPYVL